jgi:hypothetical protein
MGKAEGRNNLQYLSTDRMILKWVSNKWERTQIGFIWLRIWTQYWLF